MSPERWRAIVRGEAGDPGAFFLRRLLWLGQWPYRVGVWWRNRRFDAGRGVERVDVPVISVGNITLGGTGKTPCVEHIARLLREHEFLVAILSRGYGAAGGRNDEAMVLEENLPDVPHYQDRDRVAIARTAIDESESEVLVLDDGFQHRRLARALDIVLVDATDPWGGGCLFPRGGLREPKRNLRRAGLIVLTRCDAAADVEGLSAEVRRLAANVPIARTRHAPLAIVNSTGAADIKELHGKTVGAFCGIGNPEAFRQTLGKLNANVVNFRAYPDHHNYDRADVDDLMRWASTLPAEAWIATTQKDWVKLRLDELAGRPLWAVRIGLQFQAGKAEFDNAVLQAANRGKC